VKSGTSSADGADALTRLDDYVRGSMDDVEADTFEQDLFERALAGSAPELSFRASLGATFREMSARGSIDLWLTAEGLSRLQAQGGLRVVLFELDLEHPSLPEIPEGTDLLVTRVPVDLQGIGRLEAEVFSLDGRLLKRMPDITFDPADGAVFACCEAELARHASAAQTMTRIWAVREEGRSLLLELPCF